MNLRRLALVPAVILILGGLVWFLQGTGVMKGSSMTGSRTFEVLGFVLVILGVILGRFGFSRASRS